MRPSPGSADLAFDEERAWPYWRTASEERLLGFHIWRGTSRVGLWKRLTPKTIRARGAGTTLGDRYRFVDRRAPHGSLYYRLQAVGLSGERRFVGAVGVVRK